MKQVKQIRGIKLALALSFALLGAMSGCGGGSGGSSGQSSSNTATTVSADDAIVGVSTIGFMAPDGTKLSAIVVEYRDDIDLAGADVNADTYDLLNIYKPDSLANVVNSGDKEIGEIIDIYVSDRPEASAAASGTAKYVIIKLYTDFVLASEPNYKRSLAAGVTQKNDIKATKFTITSTSSNKEVVNYKMVESAGGYGGGPTSVPNANHGTFTIEGLAGYKLYTNVPGVYGSDGKALTDYVFNEKDGTYYNYDQGYALYVPEACEPEKIATGKKCALVTVDHTIDAGTHPYESLVSNYGPAYFITKDAQQVVKDKHGLEGLIVVVPQIIERVDDNSCVPGMWMTLMKLWDQLQKDYPISEDHVYGAGQSMGGMLLMETNLKRDNYFAGILSYGNQWGQNYYKDAVYARGMTGANWTETAATTPRHYPSTASNYYIWDYHWGDDGKKVEGDAHDPNNFYYMISDDNLMVFNGNTNFLSLNLWNEMSMLYQDIVDYKIPWLNGLDSYADIKDQNKAVNDFVAQGSKYKGNDMGLYRVSWEGGANDATAIWSRRITAGYEWLLSQNRQTEMKRPKLDLNKIFVPTTQIRTDDRKVVSFFDKDTGGDVYFLTGEKGSGTRFYNTSWLQAGASVPAEANPGWLPDGMSHPVDAATIKSVKSKRIGNTVVAVAIEYDQPMVDVVIHMKGDPVINSKGDFYNDYFVTQDPYDFYDANGDKIPAVIQNYYVRNSIDELPLNGAYRGEGSGRCVIVEIYTLSTAVPVSVIQKTTVRTNKAIASASSTMKP
jgi:predicted peptidase